MQRNRRPAPGVMPDGLRVYAIGDIHGHANSLARMLMAISGHAQAHPIDRSMIVYLGDYIDRGPASNLVVEAVMHHVQNGDGLVVALRGNHEQMLLDGLETDSCFGHWLMNGGGATMVSYAPEGVEGAQPRDLIPASHLDFMRGLPLSFSVGGYFFAHAGVRPGVPLEAQGAQDLLWIRQPFLFWQDGCEIQMPVVHGHTPHKEVEVLPHRIGVDTGAAFGGPLACVVLEADTVEVLQV